MKRVEKIKKQYAKMEWYKQGAAVRPFYIGYPWKSCMELTLKGKWLGLNYLPFCVYLKNDFFDVYFPKKNMEKIAIFYFSRENKNPGFTAALKKRWEKENVAGLWKIISVVESSDLSNLHNKELISLFKRFTQIYVAFWREAIFLDAFDVMSDTILNKALKKEKKIKEKDLNLLTSPVELSWFQKQKEELLKLTGQAFFSDFEEKLKTHAARYHWIYNDYAIIRNLDWKFFLGEIKKLRRNKKLYQEEKHTFELFKNVAYRRQKLIKKLKLSPNFVRRLTFS